jgi:hypothetical protein
MELYVEDLLAPKGALMAEDGARFFSVEDTTGTCGADPEGGPKTFPVTRGYIERVEFQDAPDGTLSRLSVFGHRGERTVTLAQANACLASRGRFDFRPAAKPYRVDFRFDDGRMVRVGSSPSAPK